MIACFPFPFLRKYFFLILIGTRWIFKILKKGEIFKIFNVAKIENKHWSEVCGKKSEDWSCYKTTDLHPYVRQYDGVSQYGAPQ